MDVVGDRYSVSIHVPLAEHDRSVRGWNAGVDRFNSRAPRGARQSYGNYIECRTGFNSRAPRGARLQEVLGTVAAVLRVSIHVPLAEHDLCPLMLIMRLRVSIHVPLAEHDARQRSQPLGASKFQFTCPSRSTTIRSG